jgi:hypothetical protein
VILETNIHNNNKKLETIDNEHTRLFSFERIPVMHPSLSHEYLLNLHRTYSNLQSLLSKKIQLEIHASMNDEIEIT